MNKCLFLDRDGVINQDVGYAHRPEQIEFMPGIFSLCRAYQRKGYRIIVVTNQAGIARKYFSKYDMLTLHRWLTSCFQKKHIKISDIFFCPHHPGFTGACPCRKPKAGMFRAAIARHKINPHKSLMVGDKTSDLVAAKTTQVARLFLYQPNKHNLHRSYNRFHQCKHLTQLIKYA